MRCNSLDEQTILLSLFGIGHSTLGNYCNQQRALFVLERILFCFDQLPATVSLRPAYVHVTAFLIVFMSWNAEMQCG